MAVEAKHFNLFSSQQQQIFSNQVNGFSYNTQMGSALPLPTQENSSFLPFHHSLMCDSVQPKTSVNTDSGLTFNLPPTANANAVNIAATRKRSRDSFNTCNNTTASFVGDDVLPLLQQYQLDIDRIISHHTKKIRLELEERQKQQARALVAAIGEGVTKKLKEKDEQIQRMGKINFVLQEKVKSLYVENQLWRDLAQTNEATANSLRNNLEQVLAHVGDERLSAGGNVIGAALEEDVESCCGSNDHGAAAEEEEEIEGRRTLAGEAQDNRMCKRCGERESSVLLLPCRHLCLCSVCGSTLLHTCPVCNSNMNATVHVNMSS
ncbi:putative BOI-related E3 ubiquitin-protein ligase 3 [Nicotiana tabacum]|uniref:BOI-related E3 ubiquitin-protein ligase 3 n=1 Tax=Nicotiana tabacum TaxID=4097 RepID=A0A1S4D1U4_TOBAC|nr:PREDICTED: probable BOI-related E3 ubiquitin-protein ligase 3 [Nicotiana tabacum]XP_033512439.1 probable BOI-related E3 ubiquitin-protein ligase 3 [Nicotiana tomentosiformis]XP_033512440.1 probable BOI-related E3 ubiquitin-protein ligase 3 [Nicotiana tomentosiformis]